MKQIKNKILEEYKKGNIVVAEMEELRCIPISEFIMQPVEGMLYDLNRTEEVILTFLHKPKWVNDYAVAQVIRALKNRIDEFQLYERNRYKSSANMETKISKLHQDAVINLSRKSFEIRNMAKTMKATEFYEWFNSVCDNL